MGILTRWKIPKTPKWTIRTEINQKQKKKPQKTTKWKAKEENEDEDQKLKEEKTIRRKKKRKRGTLREKWNGVGEMTSREVGAEKLGNDKAEQSRELEIPFYKREFGRRWHPIMSRHVADKTHTKLVPFVFCMAAFASPNLFIFHFYYLFSYFNLYFYT